jgi:hypothetical protein
MICSNYQEVLRKAIKIKKSHSHSLFAKIKNVQRVFDYMSIIIATIYLHENNDEEFLKNINDVGAFNDNKYIKHFWLYVYYLINNDLDKAMVNYDQMISCSNLPEMTKLASEALLANNNGNTEEAIKLFAQWMNEDCPKNPITKEILLNRIGDGTQEDKKTGDGSLS